MHNIILNLLTCIALIFIGVVFITTGWDHIHGFSVSSITGVLFLLFGLVWLLLIIKKKIEG